MKIVRYSDNRDRITLYQKNRTSERPPHADYLNDCFIKQIGLPPCSRQKVDITTVGGVLVAKAYNKIVSTWQGYFIELEKKDLMMTKLEQNEYPSDGEKSSVQV